MESTIEYEVIVVGAGVMGSATAYYLAKELGTKVLLLEQFDCLHRKGSSHGDSRIIRYTYPQDHYTELMFDAYKLWADAEAASNTKVFTQTGGLDIGSKGNPSIQRLIQVAKKFNVEHEIFEDAGELAKRFPMLKLQPGDLAVYSPTSGILNPTKAVAMFQQLAREHGCKLLDNIPVTNITQEGETIVVESGNAMKFRTRKCIMTSGPWARKMLKSVANLDLPLTPSEVTVAYWKVEQPEMYSSKNFPIFINYNEPMLYGLPCHEFPNLLKCCPWGGEKVTDPDKRTFNPNLNGIVNEVGPWLQRALTGINRTHQMTESCICTDTPDGDFIIDQVPGFPEGNLLVGCGFSGHGFKLAPVVGNLLAKWTMTGQFPYSSNLQNIFSLKRFESGK